MIVSLYIHFLSKDIISFAFMAEKKNPTFSLHKLSLSFYVYEGLPECVYVHHVHTWGPQKSEEGIRSLETGVMDDWEPPCGRC